MTAQVPLDPFLPLFRKPGAGIPTDHLAAFSLSNSHRVLGCGMDRREGGEGGKLGKEGEGAEAYSLWAQETLNFLFF